MKILLTGSTGFIGSRLRKRLLLAGHAVVCADRSRPERLELHTEWVPIDFTRPPAEAEWIAHLKGVDVVVNAVGIFRETGALSFDDLHVRAPRALFSACAKTGVARVVQLSALGADEHADTAYHLSKRAADDYLLGLPLDGVVAQPSLVFGAAGTGSRFFLALASLPVLLLPAGGRQPVQPVHVDDAVEALLALVQAPADAFRGQRVALVGPAPLMLAAYLRSLREGLRLPPAREISVPAALVSLGARWGDRAGSGLLDTASWRMLQRGNVAPPDAITRLLHRAPRTASQFIAQDPVAAVRTQAQLGWLLPLLRWSIAAVWIFTGIVSLGLFPLHDSYALLARAGVAAPWRPFLLFGAAALDLVIGLLTLVSMRRKHRLWLAQALLIAGYMVIISWKLPEFWLHPYGPILKNLPMLAALALLYTLEPRDRA